jgi:hypothetical protein
MPLRMEEALEISRIEEKAAATEGIRLEEKRAAQEVS